MASELTKEEQEKKLVEKFDKLRNTEDTKWQHEMELLETRTETNLEDIELEKGGAIAIYSSLDNKTRKRIIALFAELKKMKEPTEWEEEDIIKADEFMYEVFELMTPNPHFTKEWFKANPEKFSQSDIERLILRARIAQTEKELKEQRRIPNIKSFRR